VANLFVNLPIPAGDGDGAAVDVSTLGVEKTFVIGNTPGPSGESFRCTLNVQMSNEALAPGPDSEWAPVATFQLPGDQTILVAAKWLRIRRSDSKSPAGTPTCDVGSDDSGVTLVSLPTTVGDGSGASVDTSAMGSWKTVQAGGDFRGNVNIEISNDNIHFSPVVSFSNPGQQSATFVAKWMRVTRDGVPTISPGLPIVNVAAGSFGGGGGGGGGGLQFFTVAGVVGQSLYAVTLPTARADALYQVIPTVSSPTPNTVKPITVDPTTITALGFTAEMTTGAEAGDILVFFVHNL